MRPGKYIIVLLLMNMVVVVFVGCSDESAAGVVFANRDVVAEGFEKLRLNAEAVLMPVSAEKIYFNEGEVFLDPDKIILGSDGYYHLIDYKSGTIGVYDLSGRDFVDVIHYEPAASCPSNSVYIDGRYWLLYFNRIQIISESDSRIISNEYHLTDIVKCGDGYVGVGGLPGGKLAYVFDNDMKEINSVEFNQFNDFNLAEFSKKKASLYPVFFRASKVSDGVLVYNTRAADYVTIEENTGKVVKRGKIDQLSSIAINNFSNEGWNQRIFVDSGQLPGGYWFGVKSSRCSYIVLPGAEGIYTLLDLFSEKRHQSSTVVQERDNCIVVVNTERDKEVDIKYLSIKKFSKWW